MAKVRMSYRCDQQWSSMEEVGTSRHCEACDRVVRDASSMTDQELHAVLAEEPEPCLLISILPDGTPVTLDKLRSGFAAAALSTAVLASGLGCDALDEGGSNQAAESACETTLTEHSAIVDTIENFDRAEVSPEMAAQLRALGYIVVEHE